MLLFRHRVAPGRPAIAAGLFQIIAMPMSYIFGIYIGQQKSAEPSPERGADVEFLIVTAFYCVNNKLSTIIYRDFVAERYY